MPTTGIANTTKTCLANVRKPRHTVESEGFLPTATVKPRQTLILLLIPRFEYVTKALGQPGASKQQSILTTHAGISERSNMEMDTLPLLD